MSIAQSINSMSEDQLKVVNNKLAKAFVKKIIITTVITVAVAAAVELVGKHIDSKNQDEAE